MLSKTYGELTIEEMVEKIKQYIEQDTDSGYTISIGTDSQNHHLTKMVVVVAVHRHGKGGIFFYDIKHEPLIISVRQKIYYETALSLDIAQKIAECFAVNNIQQEIEIHCDIGLNKNGKTYELVKEISGWVNSAGYSCVIKPDSYTSSCIADKISK